jgi:microcystin-dependent protein
MTERYDNFAVNVEATGFTASVGTHPSTSYAYFAATPPTDWEHPMAWKQLEKILEPIFKESARQIINFFAENGKSLEDFLSTQTQASYSKYGGTVYGDATIGDALTILGATYMNQQLWRKYGDVYDPVGHVHVGMVVPFAGNATTPNGGWLLCDGSYYSQSDYTYLYSAIGTTYNNHCGAASPPAGTFRVPNYQGRVLVGLNPSDADFDALTDYGGAKTHTLTESEMPSHSHGITPNGSFVGTTAFADTTAVTSLSQNNDFQTTSKGSGSAHNNMQPYAVARYIIKY